MNFKLTFQMLNSFYIVDKLIVFKGTETVKHSLLKVKTFFFIK